MLMCFYHVKANIRHKCKAAIEILELYVNQMNSSKNELEFNNLLKDLQHDLEEEGYPEIFDYFYTSWVQEAKGEEVTRKYWRKFDSSPGVPNTNNAAEGFNRAIKDLFGRKSLKMIECLERILW